MKIKNLTPHPITINGVNYPPEGIVPRVAEIREEPIIISGGLELNRIYVGEVVGLPEPSDCFLEKMIFTDSLKLSGNPESGCMKSGPG